MMESNKITYKNLWEKKTASGKTWTEIRTELNLSKQVIGNINKNKFVSLSTLVKLAIYFDCDIGDIVQIKRD